MTSKKCGKKDISLLIQHSFKTKINKFKNLFDVRIFAKSSMYVKESIYFIYKSLLKFESV